MKKEFIPIIQFTGILLVGTIIIATTAWLVNVFREPEIKIVEKIKEVPIILKAPKCLRSFEMYQDLIKGGQSIKLLEDKRSYVENNVFTEGSLYNVLVKRSGSGLIACGYLYVKASAGNNPLNNKYDSIYINPHNRGGHLLRPRSMPLVDSSLDATEILLPLEAIPYLPKVPYSPDAQSYEIANWVKLLNSGSDTIFYMGLSTENKFGKIEEVRVAYKCWDPSTGEETQDCQLSK